MWYVWGGSVVCSMPSIFLCLYFYCRDFISLLSDSEDEEDPVLQQALRESMEQYQKSFVGQQDGQSSSVK